MGRVGDGGRLSGAIPAVVAGGSGGASGLARGHGLGRLDTGRTFHSTLGAPRTLADLGRGCLWCDWPDPQPDHTQRRRTGDLGAGGVCAVGEQFGGGKPPERSQLSYSALKIERGLSEFIRIYSR